MKNFKKVILGLMIVLSLSTQAQAQVEPEHDYTTPLLVGGGLILIGIATGGAAYLFIGPVALSGVAVGGVTVGAISTTAVGTGAVIGSATAAGGAYVYENME